MKKVLLVVFVALLTACSGKKKEETPYYPLEELTSSGAYDEKLLEHFKEEFRNSGLLETENLALKIDDSVRETVILYVLDETGKAIQEYSVTGKMKEDIIFKSSP